AYRTAVPRYVRDQHVPARGWRYLYLQRISKLAARSGIRRRRNVRHAPVALAGHRREEVTPDGCSRGRMDGYGITQRIDASCYDRALRPSRLVAVASESFSGFCSVIIRYIPPNAAGSSRSIVSPVPESNGPNRRFMSENRGFATMFSMRRRGETRSSSRTNLSKTAIRPPPLSTRAASCN